MPRDQAVGVALRGMLSQRYGGMLPNFHAWGLSVGGMLPQENSAGGLSVGGMLPCYPAGGPEGARPHDPAGWSLV